MRLQKNSTLLFIGDSVTDAGRARPVAEGHFGQLGGSYVGIIQSLLDAYRPDCNLRILNTGVSGDTSQGLKGRWQEDVLAHKPNYVSLLIGINDVWHQYDSPRSPQNRISLETYKATLESLILSSLVNGVEQVILFTPFYIEPSLQDPVRVQLGQYGEAVKQLAAKHHCILADAQAAFDEACKQYHSSMYSSDRVHPNQTGHTILAKTFLEAIDVKLG